MTNNKNFFEVFKTCMDKSITMANGGSAKVQGIEDGYLACKDSEGKQNTVKVKEVLYVSTLEENLSVRKLT